MALQFNPGDGTGAVDEINDICNSDNNSYPLLSKARRVNQAIRRFYQLAFEADGRWAWDDPNYDTVPIQTINLVSGTQAYNLDDFTSEVLYILRVEILDSAGQAKLLKRLDRKNVKEALTAYKNTNGLPEEYDLVGEYLYLYPAPNYNSTNGLKLYIQRDFSPLTAGSTTTQLPVPSLFNRYICNLASLPWLIENQKSYANSIASLVAQDEASIESYFLTREETVPRRMYGSLGDNR